MKPGWRRFWLPASITTICLGALALANAAAPKQHIARHNELKLAGFEPGVSKLPLGPKPIFGFGPARSSLNGFTWEDSCDGRTLVVQSYPNRIIQTVTVSDLGAKTGSCVARDESALLADLRTGRGLELGDACTRVTALYGEPESRGPSLHGALTLELLFYSFDWAGNHVPQSMEVSCDSAGRVAEITLAAASL